jgi:nucleotide-binding universal stress UspA family protein
MYKKILVPLDGSKMAEIALPHAESLALQYQADLVLLSVIDPPSMTGRGDPAVQLFQQEMDTKMQAAEIYLKALKNQFSKKTIKAKYFVNLGSVVQNIIDIANSESVDLVLIASHGRSGLQRVFFGSVAAGVLNRIEQPLMVIRRPGK